MFWFSLVGNFFFIEFVIGFIGFEFLRELSFLIVFKEFLRLIIVMDDFFRLVGKWVDWFLR